MSYDLTLDLDSLLAPISERLPCGEARENSSSVELSRAFSVVLGEWQAAKKMEKEWADNQLLFVGRDETATHADWMPIAEKAIQYLTQHSKDARIVSSLIEAMTRLNGFNGLQQSLSLLRQLLERYPEHLNPRPEPTEESAPFDSISSNLDRSKTFFDAIRKATISSSSEFRLLSLFDLELAKYFDSSDLSPEVKSSLEARGQLTQNRFNQILLRVPKEDLLKTQSEIAGALDEAKKINELLAKLRPESASSDVSISNTLRIIEEVQLWFTQLTAGKLADNKSNAAGKSEGSSGPGQAANSQGGMAGGAVAILEGQLQNREQAFEQLLKVAEYFRKTEPHSPISYSLEQAVRWGRMPLPQFLEEVLRNDEALSEVYRRIGYRPKSESQ
jgi:type VI secretion system protein ImpA